MDEFLQRIAAILEEASVKSDDRLLSFANWDSLTILAVIAMIDEKYNVSVGSEDLDTVETVGDLQQLVERRRK